MAKVTAGTALGMRVKEVRLDGIRQADCVEADADEGWVRVIVMEGGRPAIKDDLNILTETKFGVVEILMKEEDE